MAVIVLPNMNYVRYIKREYFLYHRNITWIAFLKSNAIDFCNLMSRVHKASFTCGGNCSLDMRVPQLGEDKAY